MNPILLFTVILLSIAKLTVQDCCFVTMIQGDNQSSYYVDVIVKPAPSQEISISYVENYDIVGLDSICQAANDGFNNKVVCQRSQHPDFFQTRLIMKDPTGAYINQINMNVYSDDHRCTRSYESCNADGTVSTKNGDNYCLSFLGCYPKLACYIALGVFVICIAGITLAVIRRNSGSGEKAALDRPNTKAAHLDARPDPINNYTSSNNKETLIQIDEMPVDFKEAGSTKWVNKKYNSPSDLGLGLGSGGFGSRNSLLPTSNVTVINDPSAGLNRGRSVKRTQSTKSTKKNRANDPNHLNAPPLPGSPLHSPNLGRTKSTRSTKSAKSVKSTKSTKKGSSNLANKKSIRNQPSQKRYQIPSDSESDSDSDNEVLGLRAKSSMKKLNNGSLPRNKGYYSSSTKGKTSRY